MTKLWGSRFQSPTDPMADAFTSSIDYDQRLAKYDCLGSIAHAKMLGKCGIIPKGDAQKIVGALKQIWTEVESGRFRFDRSAEDIHTNIQQALKKKIGSPADKLHTARSRNDQVVLDVKLYCRDEINLLMSLISALQSSIVNFARKYGDVIIPGYTHLQSAQVVLLAHHMLAYVEMLQRDKDRFASAHKRANVLPLGSGAISGTTLPIDRAYVARELGFDSLAANSMDVVSDRDFIAEIISAAAICGVHLSRFAEDLVLWSTREFHFVTVDWAYCTGSSMMPHKKNPDVLELIRGSSARINGNLTEILTLLKGLPLTYNRDLQLDKPPLFETIDTLKTVLGIFSGVFASLKINAGSLKFQVQDESFFSVDIMEYLIQKGASYRQAHDTVGEIVKECLDQGLKISDLTAQQLKKFSPLLKDDVKKILNPSSSVRAKKSFGSTQPAMVQAQLAAWTKKLKA